MITELGAIGGIFALLTFVHFAIDWIFQSHAEAMAKPAQRYRGRVLLRGRLGATQKLADGAERGLVRVDRRAIGFLPCLT